MAEGGVIAGLVGNEAEEREIEGAASGADPIATSIATEQAKFDPLLARKAGDYLDEQRSLVRLQLKHFDAERRLAIDAARRKRFADRIRNGLASIFALVVVGVLVLFAWMAWDASNDHGLVIRAFSVPPALAQDGLSGEVVAARFLDKLQALQNATVSVRPAKSYQNDWDSQIKVDIPETGISFGEVAKMLREKLGHASHIRGEVFRSGAGVALSVRLDDLPAQTFRGDQSRLDELAQQAAEVIYATSQPYRYADYLVDAGHVPQAIGVLSQLANTGPESERGWAFAQWAIMDVNELGDVKASVRHARRALDYSAGSQVLAWVALVGAAVWSGHAEEEAQDQKTLDDYSHKRSLESTKAFFDATNHINAAYDADLEADFQKASTLWPQTPVAGDLFDMRELAPAMTATSLALAHDPQAAMNVDGIASTRDDSSFLKADAFNGFTGLPHYWISVANGDWSGALADVQNAAAWQAANATEHGVFRLIGPVWIQPLQALAEARTGDLAGAEARIAQTPPDCYLCLRMRGQIAAQRQDWPAAERWFTEAVRQAPTPPQAYLDWGLMRLAKGDLDGAIAEFKIAHEKAPHFADPLKGWGDALMRQGDAAQALKRFDEALRYAPAWTALRYARDAAAVHKT